jgi:hypothetical protein
MIFLVIFVYVVVGKSAGKSGSSFSVVISGGADGPTTIYVAGDYFWQSILRHALTIVLAGIVVFMIFDVAEFIKEKTYTLKYKLKVVFVVDGFIILAAGMRFGFLLLKMWH